MALAVAPPALRDVHRRHISSTMAVLLAVIATLRGVVGSMSAACHKKASSSADPESSGPHWWSAVATLPLGGTRLPLRAPAAEVPGAPAQGRPPARAAAAMSAVLSADLRDGAA